MVGDKLRAEREKQNLTVKDIEKGTSIRALYIECIEKGDYEQLPGEVYTKGFIRNYANYLKLNATELVHEFVAERHPEKAAAAPAAQAAKTEAAPAAPQKRQAPAPTAHETASTAVQLKDETVEEKKAPAAEAPAAAPRQAPPRPAAPARQERQERKPRKAVTAGNSFSAPASGNSNRSKFIILAVVLVVVVGVAAYLLGSSSSETPAPAPQQAQQQQQAAAPQKTYDGVEVTGKFSDDCWIEVKADGKVVYEGTLKKGDSMDWKGQENVTVRAGNAGAVEFTVNGKDLGKAGKEGQVANKTFTKDAN